MSRVFLIANHHDLGIKTRRVELKEEMWSWPIYAHRGVRKQPTDLVYKNALRALTELGPFNSEFCIEVDLPNQILRFADRCWGAIWLNEEVIVHFSHDTRYDNSPFRSLIEWPEMDNDKVVKGWTSDQWKIFFVHRIKNDSLKRLTWAKSDLASSELAVKKANDRLKEQQKQTEAIMLAIKDV